MPEQSKGSDEKHQSVGVSGELVVPPFDTWWNRANAVNNSLQNTVQRMLEEVNAKIAAQKKNGEQQQTTSISSIRNIF